MIDLLKTAPPITGQALVAQNRSSETTVMCVAYPRDGILAFPLLTARVRTRTEKHSAVTDREAHKRRELVYTAQHEKGKQIHRRDHISLYHSIIR